MSFSSLIRSFAVAGIVCIASARAAHAEWTLGAFLGGASTQASSIQLRQPSQATHLILSPVHYDSESLDSPIYYGYRVGFFPGSGWLGIEGELVHLKVVADTARTARFDGALQGEVLADTRPLAPFVERFSISHGVNLLLVNAVVRKAAGGRASAPPRWFLVGRFGAGASRPHPESTIGGLSLERYEWGSLSAQAAAGVELRLTTHLYLSGEYKLTRTIQDVSVVDGTARTPLTSHHLAAGVVVHLGG